MNVGRVRRNNNRDYCIYKDRIIADSGLMKNDVNSLDYINYLRSIGCYDNSKLIWTGEMGYKKRTSTIYDYISKAYDAGVLANNIAQITEINQPFISGNIAPNEKLCAKNNNGLETSLTHPTINFAANEAWSIVICFSYYGDSKTVTGIVGDNSTVISTNSILIRRTSTNRISFFNSLSTGYNLYDTNEIIGKNCFLNLIADGNGNILVYINGVLKSTTVAITSISFGSIFKQYSTSDTTKRYNGTISFYRIQSGAMSQSQITSEYNFLRSKYPEIESVTIGTQVWSSSNWEAVCTPVGNVIPNVTVNADWANATVLYTIARDAASGTTEQKEYAGYKAAAMWSYYNNDPILGSVYGKLYNWYAVKLFDLDMATAGYGWHIPTQAEFETLSTYLGGNTISGSKIKKEGLNYWITPNTGATNESFFSAIPSGLRLNNGVFAGIGYSFYTAIIK